MPWIESHKTIRDHPKTLRLARTLKINKAQAIGHLHLLWWWTLDYAPTGDLSAFTSCEICGAVEWTGNEDNFVRALKETGWMDEDGKLHDWDQYAGPYLKMLERQRRYRRRNSYVTVTSNQTQPNQTRPDQPNTYVHEFEDASRTSPPTITNLHLKACQQDFERIWSKYPKRIGKKQAERHWFASVLTSEDAQTVEKALANYLASDRVRNGYVQNGSTWFNNWKDWVDYVELPKQGGNNDRRIAGEAGYRPGKYSTIKK